MTNITQEFDYWCVSCGTGGTLAGLLSGLSREVQLLGFPALKGGEYLNKEIREYLDKARIIPKASWGLHTEYHFGGYAKVTPELVRFINDFKSQYGILLDPIYTGKMMFGVIDQIKKGAFEANSRILTMHTGGLQGIAGIEKKYGIKIN